MNQVGEATREVKELKEKKIYFENGAVLNGQVVQLSCGDRGTLNNRRLQPLHYFVTDSGVWRYTIRILPTGSDF